MVYLFSLAFCLLAIALPQKFFKFLAVFSFLMVFSMIYSYGKISHDNHVWLISAFLMLFFSSQSLLNSKSNLFLIRLIQSLILSHYFISGVWKLKKIFPLEYSLESIALESFAYALAEKGLDDHFLIEFFGLYWASKILGWGLFFVISFQLSCLIPILCHRYFMIYGFFAVLFHASTGVALLISFKPTVLAVLFFLILTEMMIKQEKLPLETR